MPRFVKGLALMGAAALLAGCAPTGATAAVVNGVAIPQSRVSTIAEGCAAALNDSGQAQQKVTPQRVEKDALRIVVVSERSAQYLVEAAGMGDQLAEGQSAVDFLASHEVSGPGVPTSEEIRAAVDPQQEVLLKNEECAAGIMGLTRHNLLATSAGAAYFDTPAEITVNPRYGVFDTSSLEIVNSGSLSELAEDRG